MAEDTLIKSMALSTAGMRAQSMRLRVIAENMANANSLATEPGGLPYRRKIITFRNELNRKTGLDEVKVHKIGYDKTPFSKRYEPHHPSADEKGYILTPNVNTLIETMDMREAQRSYDANMNILRNSKSMLQKTISILR